MRFEVSPEMKYFCITEAIALYLQKYIQYRKRKIFFGKQTAKDLEDVLKKHSKEKFLFPCSDVANEETQNWLQVNGYNFTPAVLFRTALPVYSLFMKLFPTLSRTTPVSAAFGAYYTTSVAGSQDLDSGYSGTHSLRPSMNNGLLSIISSWNKGTTPASGERYIDWNKVQSKSPWNTKDQALRERVNSMYYQEGLATTPVLPGNSAAASGGNPFDPFAVQPEAPAAETPASAGLPPQENTFTPQVDATPAFWIYFPEARHVFVNKEVVNRHNDATGLSYDDVFIKRMFSSYIVKQSNPEDLRIKDYIADGVDRLYESERIKKTLMDYEQDLWSY
ncbi:hypothetical protein FQR65_LT16019 [Abscondita terminalis]|nr:hypothetical protein FQR65_LT16019 [Abscondita terminalis]